VQLIRQFVQHLVGRAVIDLPPVAEAPRDRAEKDEEFQTLSAQFASQRYGAVHLGAEYLSEGIQRFVADAAIRDDAGPVNHAIESPEPFIHAVDQAAETLAVTHIQSVIFDGGTRSRASSERGSNLAILQQSSYTAFDLSRHKAIPLGAGLLKEHLP
jgi:hypothetical protein